MTYFNDTEDFEITSKILETGEEFNPLHWIDNSVDYEDELLHDALHDFKQKKQRKDDDNA